jgi:hypothetical protein
MSAVVPGLFRLIAAAPRSAGGASWRCGSDPRCIDDPRWTAPESCAD